MIMRINANTRLSRVLDLDPAVVDYIVSLNPHDFKRLHNPIMRHFMAPRITLGRVAAMVGVPVDDMLHHIAELIPVTVETTPALALAQSPQQQPAWVAQANVETIVEVDLLPLDEALNADPMLPVITAVKALQPGQALRIKHKWEPQPFYDVWSKMGQMEWFAQQIGPDEWWIWVRRTG